MKPISSDTNNLSTDTDISEDPDAYDQPPDISTNDTRKNNTSEDASTQKNPSSKNGENWYAQQVTFGILALTYPTNHANW